MYIKEELTINIRVEKFLYSKYRTQQKIFSLKLDFLFANCCWKSANLFSQYEVPEEFFRKL